MVADRRLQTAPMGDGLSLRVRAGLRCAVATRLTVTAHGRKADTEQQQQRARPWPWPCGAVHRSGGHPDAAGSVPGPRSERKKEKGLVTNRIAARGRPLRPVGVGGGGGGGGVCASVDAGRCVCAPCAVVLVLRGCSACSSVRGHCSIGCNGRSPRTFSPSCAPFPRQRQKGSDRSKAPPAPCPLSQPFNVTEQCTGHGRDGDVRQPPPFTPPPPPPHCHRTLLSAAR